VVEHASVRRSFLAATVASLIRRCWCGFAGSLCALRARRGSDDHGRLKFRLRPMRGLKNLGCAQVVSAGHAFIQNIRRGHYELGVEETVNLRVLAVFDELALAI
jgi:hypothetical protein